MAQLAGSVSRRPLEPRLGDASHPEHVPVHKDAMYFMFYLYSFITYIRGEEISLLDQLLT